MKALIWIIALVLAIPTFGISLAIAMVITMYLNKQDRIAAADFIVSAASTLKNDILNKYYRFRMQESLPPTTKTDSDILDSVMKCYTMIERVLKENGRFHDDKDEVIQLAVRLTSYSEDLDPDDYVETLKRELVYVGNTGVVAALRKPYNDQNKLFNHELPF